MNSKLWTTEEIDFLKEYYPSNGPKYCSEKLGRTVAAVIRRAKLNKIKNKRIKMQYGEENIKTIISESKSITEALDKLGLRAAGGNFAVVKKYIKLYGIDISHFTKQSDRARDASNSQKRPLSALLVKGSKIKSASLKKRLYDEGLKERKCELCGQGEIWQGKQMSLILDHINGDSSDNTFENLQIVCPNCEGTLDTHCRGMKPRKIKGEDGRKLQKWVPKSGKRKAERPPLEQILREVNKMGYQTVGKKYGVSDNAIKKWIKSDKEMDGKKIRGRKKKTNGDEDQLKLL